MLERIWSKKNPHTLLVELQIGNWYSDYGKSEMKAVTTDTTETKDKKILQLYVNKLDNLEEIDS